MPGHGGTKGMMPLKPKSLPNLATNDDAQMGMESHLPADVFSNSNADHSGNAIAGSNNKLNNNLGIADSNTRNQNFGTRDEDNSSLEGTTQPNFLHNSNSNTNSNMHHDTNSSAANFMDGQIDRFGNNNTNKTPVKDLFKNNYGL